MKKALTFLLALAMLQTMLMSSSAYSFSDTKNAECETAVEVLTALGILEGKSEDLYEPNAPLTRAEITAIMLRSMNVVSTGAGRDIFTDVTREHWAYDSISVAYQMGIVNGASETAFMPDAKVTYEQAVKMVVTVLGYSVKAESMGGYPSGYLAQASQLGILKGVNAGGEITRGDVAILIYNSLNTELFLRTSYGDEALAYQTDKAKTLLSYYLKIDCITAEITATPICEITNPVRKLLSDEVAIDTSIMKVGKTDAHNMLGMRADIYIRKDDDSKVPVILAIVSRSNTVVVDLKAADIQSVKNGRMSYVDVTGNERKAIISDAILIYNGRVETNKTYLENMVNGTVRLISNNGGDFKYIIAEEYKNYVVDRVLPLENTVYFKNSGVEPMVIDVNEHGTFLTNAEGTPLTLADLMEWDILSVAESNDKKMRRIRSSFATITGTVTELGENSAVVDGATYRIASPLAFGAITLGKAATISLDYAGAIAAVDDSTVKGYKYGWLVGAADEKRLGAVPQLKIFTEEGKMQIYETAEKVTLNGAVVNQKELLINSSRSGTDLFLPDTKTPLVDSSGNVVPQLLKYETNSHGLITNIETATNKSNPLIANKESHYEDGDFSMDWYFKSPSNGQVNATEFNGEPNGTGNRLASAIECINGIYFGNVRTDGDTKCFVIPYELDNEADYKIRSMSGFTMERARLDKNVAFYDIDENYHCGAMVLHSYLGGGSSDGYPDVDVDVAMVLGQSRILSNDGETVNALMLYTEDGKEINVEVEEDMVALYANTASDITRDEKWYPTNGRNDTPLTSFNREDYKKRFKSSDSDPVFTQEPRGALPMYLAIDDLVPGDVIQYEVNPSGVLTRVAVQFRCEYPGQMELFQKVDCDIYGGTTRVLNYVTGGKVRINGIVKKTMGTAILVETYSVNTNGTLKENPFYRALANKGTYVLWDFKRNEMRKITMSEIVEGDEIFTFWSNTDQKLTVVYRNR